MTVEIEHRVLRPIAANSAPRKKTSSAAPLTQRDERDQRQVALAGVREHV